MPAPTSKTPKRTFDVTLRFTERFTFRVEAANEDEAIEIADALRMDPAAQPRSYDPYAPDSIEVEPVDEAEPSQS